MPYALESDVEQLASLPLKREWNIVSVSPALEPINWQNGGSLTVTAKEAYPLSSIRIDLGEIEKANFKLEVSADGIEWRTLELKETGNGTRLSAQPGDEKLQKVRLSNVSGTEQKVNFKMFSLLRK